jgi:transcriptional regulator with XRE-family HTH domain
MREGVARRPMGVAGRDSTGRATNRQGQGAAMNADVVPVDPPERSADTAKIGQRLKAVRRAQRRTLEEVAESSGLTKGFLSKIERDLASASVAALLRICATLGIPLSSLFESDATGEVVRRGQYPKIDFGGQDLVEYLLTPAAERRVQVIISEVAPGGGSGNEGYSLPAEVEFVYVLKGSLELGFADKTVRLGVGDAFTFDPATPHTFRADAVDEPTTVMWVICPALAAAGGEQAAGPVRDGYAVGVRV